MASINDITGDTIQTKATTQQYRDNYDQIFGKKKSSSNSDLALESMVGWAQENGLYDEDLKQNPLIKKTT